MNLIDYLEHRRINVAITRARRHLVLVCDSDTINSNEHIKTLLEHVEQRGDVRSAEEFMEQLEQFDGIERPKYLRFKDTKKPDNRDIRQERDKKASKQKRDKKPQKLAPRKPPPPQHTDEDNQLRRDQLKEQISDFLDDANRHVMQFSSTLNAFERMCVHEIAESFALHHESHGDGKDRAIFVRKKRVSESVSLGDDDTQLVNPVVLPSPSKSQRNVDSVQDAQSATPEAAKDVKNEINEPLPAVQPKNVTNVHQPGAKSKSKKKKPPRGDVSLKNVEQKPNLVKKDNLAQQLHKAEDVDDFDAMIAAVQKMDSICAFVKCKVSVQVIVAQCPHCRRRFCLNHGLPEVHGCGQDAKVAARKTLCREGKLIPGSGVPNKK